MEENKKVVVEFYELAINQKNFEAASKLLGSRYIQHNPNAADGPEGLKAFIAFLREKFPDNHSDIKRIFADGDYVILHVYNVRTPGTRGNAIVDISGSKTAKSSSIGTFVRRFRNKPPIPTPCSKRFSAHSRASGNPGWAPCWSLPLT
jgi:predicted SnoaL-like aldol condensation-catalyzing enzyme